MPSPPGEPAVPSPAPIRFARIAVALVVVTVSLVSSGAPGWTAPAGPTHLGVPEGFGAKTTGGAGGTTYWVTNGADDGPGSLRLGAERPEALVIRFRVQGTIVLRRHLMVGADKTIDGRGADVTITGRGFVLTKPNVIVANLNFADFGNKAVKDNPEDAILVNGASNVWIDHCTLMRAADKAIAVPDGTDITVSWNRFVDQNQVIQIGTFTTRDVAGNARVTIHHNFFDSTGYRQPRVSYGRVHAYNNYLRNWTVHGMSAVRESQLLSQANIFEAGDKDNAVIVTGGDPEKDASPGFVRSEGDMLLNGARVRQNDPDRVVNPSTHYRVVVEAATDDLRRRLATETGWQASSGSPGGAIDPVSAGPNRASPTSTARFWWAMAGGVAVVAATAVVLLRRRRRGPAASGLAVVQSEPSSDLPEADERSPERSGNL